MPTTEQVTCRKCGLTFSPNFIFDFYPDGGDPTVGLCENCMMREAFAKLTPSGDLQPIPDGHEEAVCKLGKGKATCAFLTFTGQWCCAKGSDLERTIRGRLQDGTMGAQGDNCSGPPDFFTPTST